MTSSTDRITATVAGDGDWIRRFNPVPDAGVRLVCFPHAGGSASGYFGMAKSFASDVEVLAVQYPGRQDRRRENCVESIPEMAERALAALTGWMDRPTAFFGHSMGAVVAFEVARLMQTRSGDTPAHLFVSGRRAPSRFREGKIHLYDDVALTEELRRAGGTDARFLNDPELRDSILPVVRSDYGAVERYRYAAGSPLSCPITALVGDSDSQTTIDEASAWSEQSTGEFRLRVFTGGHFYLDRQLTAVVRAISDTLTGPSGAGPAPA
jgi:pyochelin biosynthesis protein PchC